MNELIHISDIPSAGNEPEYAFKSTGGDLLVAAWGWWDGGKFDGCSVRFSSCIQFTWSCADLTSVRYSTHTTDPAVFNSGSCIFKVVDSTWLQSIQNAERYDIGHALYRSCHHFTAMMGGHIAVEAICTDLTWEKLSAPPAWADRD